MAEFGLAILVIGASSLRRRGSRGHNYGSLGRLCRKRHSLRGIRGLALIVPIPAGYTYYSDYTQQQQC